MGHFDVDTEGTPRYSLDKLAWEVNLDLPWNPAVLEQRIGRVHRHGQPKVVHTINLIAHDTRGEVQVELIESGRVSEDLGARLAQVRELTEPPGGDEGSPTPSSKTVEPMLAAVRQLIDGGHQRIVQEGL